MHTYWLADGRLTLKRLPGWFWLIIIPGKTTENPEKAHLEIKQHILRAHILGKFADQVLNWTVRTGTWYVTEIFYSSCKTAISIIWYVCIFHVRKQRSPWPLLSNWSLFDKAVQILSENKLLSIWGCTDTQVKSASLFWERQCVIHHLRPMHKTKQNNTNKLSYRGYVMTMTLIPNALTQYSKHYMHRIKQNTNKLGFLLSFNL